MIVKVNELKTVFIITRRQDSLQERGEKQESQILCLLDSCTFTNGYIFILGKESFNMRKYLILLVLILIEP